MGGMQQSDKRGGTQWVSGVPEDRTAFSSEKRATKQSRKVVTLGDESGFVAFCNKFTYSCRSSLHIRRLYSCVCTYFRQLCVRSIILVVQ